MALTEEQILQQINVLTTKTSENPDMAFKTNATLNKGLNPDYFSGNDSKIVNAINKLAKINEANDSLVKSIADSVNNVLLDVKTTEGADIWAQTKELMESDTVIEGINAILSGKVQDKILGLDLDDIDKILVVQEQEGEAVVAPMSIEDIINVQANNISYSNDKAPSVNNVKDALDFLMTNQGQVSGGTGEGTVVVKDVDWIDIKNKPEVGNRLELTDSKLALKNEQGSVISEVELVTDEDINDLLK